jgi:hypothetical protein
MPGGCRTEVGPVLARDTNAPLRAEMQEILRLAAEPIRPNDNTKSRLARAAAVLQLGRRRAYTLWYGEATALIRDAEIERLRSERDRLYELRLARLRREIADTERRLEVLRREDLEAAASLDRAETRAGGEVDYTGLSAA